MRIFLQQKLDIQTSRKQDDTFTLNLMRNLNFRSLFALLLSSLPPSLHLCRFISLFFFHQNRKGLDRLCQAMAEKEST